MISNIKKRRQTLELSQYAVAYLTGIPQPKISLFERGLITLPAADKERIAKILQIPARSMKPIKPDINVDK